MSTQTFLHLIKAIYFLQLIIQKIEKAYYLKIKIEPLEKQLEVFLATSQGKESSLGCVLSEH